MIRTLLSLGVAAVVCAALPVRAEDAAKEAPKASAFTPAQRAELNKLIHDYIIQNPEVLNEGIEALQAKETAEKEAKAKKAVAQHSKELKDSPEGTVIGNPKGDVTLVEFFDYNCGYCKGMFPSLLETVKEDGKIRVVLKEFPILGPSSLTASRAAIAAAKQGKYSDLHIALMSHKGSLTDDSIMQIAKDTGLNMDKLKTDMKAKDVDQVIDKNQDLARDLSVDGTPALVLGDNLLSGALDKAALKDLITKARAKS